jgi:Trk K+ transport system NAD-binding subunit
MAYLIASVWLTNTVISELIPPEKLSYGFDIALWNYSYGPVYNYFFLWFQIIPFLYAFIIFIKKFFSAAQPDKKKQALYLILGSSFPIVIGILTGIILPAGGITLPPHNNMLSLIMCIFIAVGIIKYKLLSVQAISENIDPKRKIDHEIAKEYSMDFGKVYFIKHEKSSEIAHKVLLSHLYHKRYGLIITAHDPQRIRKEYGIETTPIIWITDTETDHPAVDPIDIQQFYETIKKFIAEVPNSFVLIDGLDFLILHNNFAKIHQFVRQLKSIISKSESCLIVTQGSLKLDLKNERLLEAEFNILPQEKRLGMAEEKAAKLRKPNYLVIGHNPITQSLISEFEHKGIIPTIIEKSEVLVYYRKGAVDIIKGDPLSKKVLEHAGISKPNTVVIITLEKDSDVILCINEIRQISESARIIANIHDHNFEQIAIKAGADKVIPSSSIGGTLISLALTSPEIVKWVMDATTLSTKEIQLTEMEVSGTSLVGKNIPQADDIIGSAGNILAVKTPDGLKQIPEDSYILKKGDKLVLVVNLKFREKAKAGLPLANHLRRGKF